MSEEATPSLEQDLKGTITIKVYHNHPATATFEGDLRGGDIGIAWRGMMKSYRVWKHQQMKGGK